MIKLKLSKKYNKSIFYLTISLFFVFLFAFVSKNVFNSFSAAYTDITTQVTVGNSAPTFSAGPTESAPGLTGGTYDSCAGAAVSGATITFSATGTDSNTHSYYFLVCSTSSVTPPGTPGQIPTCAGTAYCNSGATAIASGTGTSCTYNSSGTSAWSTSWYGIVCDNYAADQKCSSSIGSGNSGSPLFVNHPPAFSVANAPSAANPGSTFTWTTTSSDPDASPMNNIKLLVCKTTGLSAGACDGGAGDTWCSTAGTETSNSTCGYVATSPYADGSYNAYPYIVDECNLASSGDAQGVLKAFTVNNVAPSVSSVTLNGGSVIYLTDNAQTSISMTAAITDNNGCRNQGDTANEISDVKGYAYRSSKLYAGCDTALEGNANYCYPELSCSPGTCNTSNGTTTYTCSAPFEHYADPTDASSPYPTETWLSSFKVTDDDAQVGTGTLGSGVELSISVGGNTTPSPLDYGILSAGTAVTNLTAELTTSPTGNTGINANVKAMNPLMCTDYSTCSASGKTPFASNLQKYSLTSGTSYASGTQITTTDALLPLLVKKRIDSTVPTKISYWGVSVPNSVLPGTYSSVVRFTYVASPIGNWY